MNQKLQRRSTALFAARRAPLGGPLAPFTAAVAERPEPIGGSSLRDCWRVVRGRRATILAATAFALAAAVGYNYVKVPTYRATATLNIDREQPNIARLDEEHSQLIESPDYIETQYRILKSRSLAKRVIRKLGLERLREFSQGGDRARRGAHGASGDGNPYVHPRVVDNFLAKLEVNPGKGTRLVELSFESTQRELAPVVVNDLAAEYIDYNLEAKWQATQKASGWLQRQLAALQAKLQASESELQEYGAQHAILFVEERKDISTEKLAQLEAKLTRAEGDRIEKQSLAMLVEDAIRRGSGLPASLSSESYQQLQSRLVELRREHSRLLVTFAAGYPAVQRVHGELAEVTSALEKERGRLLNGARERYELALKQEQLLAQAALTQRYRVNRLREDFIQYDILKREAESNRQLYERLLQRLKEAGVSAGLRASNIAVLDLAEAPQQPHRPKRLLNFVLALVAGVSAGMVLAFTQEHMTTSVRTPEEVERLTGLDLLAVVPRGRKQRSVRVHTRIRISNKAVSVSLLRVHQPPRAATKAIAPVEDAGSAPWRHENGAYKAIEGPVPSRFQAAPDSSPDGPGRPQVLMGWLPERGLAEAYRTLRSSVLLGSGEAVRRVLITSSQPQEGKTTISVNLACSLAQLGRKVLVLDADMRRAHCGRLLDVGAETGLSEYLQGLAEFDEIVAPTGVEGLDLIPGGRPNPVASDLLYSPRLAMLLRQAHQRYEHVVIDSPPSLMLSDARTISSLVEGVVLVVSDKTERNALLRTKQMFDDAGVLFLGFVMNRVDLNHPDYGYYRDYCYYSRAGEVSG